MKIVVFVCLLATCLANQPPEKRIVNGIPASIFSHPYQASLQKYVDGHMSHICGAVLIAPNKLLTAAHCVLGKQDVKLFVEVGTLVLYDTTTVYEQTVPVRSFVMHKGYFNDNVSRNHNDIAVLHLKRPVKLNPNVQIARSAPKGSSFTNTECVISGWGQTSARGPISPHLQEVKMNAITMSQCKKTWPGITKKHICVYQASAKSSVCLGDSGGPMMCGPDKDLFAGITSFASQNCDYHYPSVYTRVSEYLDWIKSH